VRAKIQGILSFSLKKRDKKIPRSFLPPGIFPFYSKSNEIIQHPKKNTYIAKVIKALIALSF